MKTIFDYERKKQNFINPKKTELGFTTTDRKEIEPSCETGKAFANEENVIKPENIQNDFGAGGKLDLDKNDKSDKSVNKSKNDIDISFANGKNIIIKPEEGIFEKQINSLKKTSKPIAGNNNNDSDVDPNENIFKPKKALFINVANRIQIPPNKKIENKNALFSNQQRRSISPGKNKNILATPPLSSKIRSESVDFLAQLNYSTPKNQDLDIVSNLSNDEDENNINIFHDLPNYSFHDEDLNFSPNSISPKKIPNSPSIFKKTKEILDFPDKNDSPKKCANTPLYKREIPKIRIPNFEEYSEKTDINTDRSSATSNPLIIKIKPNTKLDVRGILENTTNYIEIIDHLKSKNVIKESNENLTNENTPVGDFEEPNWNIDSFNSIDEYEVNDETNKKESSTQTISSPIEKNIPIKTTHTFYLCVLIKALCSKLVYKPKQMDNLKRDYAFLHSDFRNKK